MVVAGLGDDPNGSGSERAPGASSVSCRASSGAWGSGRLLAGTAFSAVLTDDGRLAIGAVVPEKLYEALG